MKRSSGLDINPNQRAEEFDLVRRALDGDETAFRNLVERYQRRVYGLAFGMLRNRDDAWDAAQEAFVKAYKNLSRFEGESAFYTWLYRITYNVCLDALRSRARRSVVDLSDRILESRALEQPIEPDRELERKELAVILNAAMNQLSDKHRAIIVLREVQELSYEEMAEVLKISKGTVMSRLFHARKNLERILEPYLESTEQPVALKIASEGA